MAHPQLEGGLFSYIFFRTIPYLNHLKPPIMHRYTLLVISVLFCFTDNGFTQPDTSFSVFHHNYLVERHADLMVFADELVAYAETRAISPSLYQSALQYKEDIASIDVWRSTDVVATMKELDLLLDFGKGLHAVIVRTGKKIEWRDNISITFRTILPFVLAILMFPLVYRLVFRRG